MALKVSREFIEQFMAADAGLDRAILLSDEALCSYYLGAMVGLLVPYLPEDEVTTLLSVTAPGGNGINRAIAPTLKRASALVLARLQEA